MKERPILFSTPMVQAILDGRKTQTRRMVKPQPDEDVVPKKVPMYMELEEHWGKYAITDESGETYLIKCPYGQPGDVLWVRETWKWEGDTKYTDIFRIGSFYYKADKDSDMILGWKPSIYMPKEAARIWLKITDVRVERLQDISANDIKSEGLAYTIDYYPSLLEQWERLWKSINGEQSWNDNPWVWVIEFERIENPKI